MNSAFEIVKQKFEIGFTNQNIMFVENTIRNIVGKNAFGGGYQLMCDWAHKGGEHNQITAIHLVRKVLINDGFGDKELRFLLTTDINKIEDVMQFVDDCVVRLNLERL